MTPDEIAAIQEWLLILEARDLELPEFHAMQLKVAKATHVMLDRIAELEAELARVKDALRQANSVRDVFAQAVVQTATGEYDELAAERERREAAKAMLQAGRDVMAVIHGDGGHYREAHGDRKAADDAISIIYKLRADLDDARERREAAEVALRVIRIDAAWAIDAQQQVLAHFARYKD